MLIDSKNGYDSPSMAVDRQGAVRNYDADVIELLKQWGQNSGYSKDIKMCRVIDRRTAIIKYGRIVKHYEKKGKPFFL